MDKTYRNYIDGQWVDGTGATLQVLNPATDKPIATVPDGKSADVDRAVAAAKRAQPAWEKVPAIQRANHLRAISAKIRANAERLARTLVLEQGKVPELAAVEVEFTASYIDYMAEWARRIEGEIVTSDSLIIGEKGIVNATVRAGVVLINGEVIGNVFATDRVELRGTARVHGDVEAPVIVVEENVVFEGHFKNTKGRSADIGSADRDAVALNR